MSITFTAAVPATTYRIVCADDVERDPATYTQEQTRPAVVRHSCASPLCREWGPIVRPHTEAPALTLHNANAALLLHLLGYPTLDVPPASGECDAVDFLGRALIALALSADPRPGRSAATMPDSLTYAAQEQTASYVELRLGTLLDLANWAILYGCPVTWHA